MGFGYRIYRLRDARADALTSAVRRMAAAIEGGVGPLAYAEAVETPELEVLRRRKPDRRLETNVECYTALLLEALGFPPSASTSVFAHARERRRIRPEIRYVGPAHCCA